MFSNEQTARRFGGPVGSSPTIPRRNTKKLDCDVNAFHGVLKNPGGNEKVAAALIYFRALEQHRKLICCVHDTADGMITLLLSLVTATAN